MKQPHLTLMQIEKELRSISKRMDTVGLAMLWRGGFGPLASNGMDVMNAAVVLKQWGKQIEADRKRLANGKRKA